MKQPGVRLDVVPCLIRCLRKVSPLWEEEKEKEKKSSILYSLPGAPEHYYLAA